MAMNQVSASPRPQTRLETLDQSIRAATDEVESITTLLDGFRSRLCGDYKNNSIGGTQDTPRAVPDGIISTIDDHLDTLNMRLSALRSIVSDLTPIA